jgi:fumarate reductase flavoprotein subunit
MGNAVKPDMSVDVVVQGSGGTGMAAAVTAARGGASVVVLERRNVVGGATNYAEGLFAVESSLQKRQGIDLTVDGAFKTHMEAGNWRANPRLVRAFIEKSASTIDWLAEMGVEFIDAREYAPGGPKAWHTVKGLGGGVVKALRKELKKLEVPLLLKTPGQRLIMRDGRVAGIEALDEESGKTLRIEAKVVVIADGGFANNQEMLAKYTTAGPNVIPFLETGKMGDGVRMAWEVGAAEEGADILMRAQPVIRTVKSLTPIAAILDSPLLWVNLDGERFCDEAVTLEWPFPGHAMANQRDQLMFTVLDEGTKEYLRDKGIDVGLGIMLPPGTKIPDIDARLQKVIEEGEAYCSDSIEELAKKMGVDPKTLADTVDEYNRFCAQGRDGLFGKDPKFLQPVRKAPFYAIRGYPSCMSTLGGIKVNHKTEVVSTKGEVIPGLYAGGNVAGGLYGGHYHLVTTGAASSFAVNSGRIAGENALEYLQKQGVRV